MGPSAGTSTVTYLEEVVAVDVTTHRYIWSSLSSVIWVAKQASIQELPARIHIYCPLLFPFPIKQHEQLLSQTVMSQLTDITRL